MLHVCALAWNHMFTFRVMYNAQEMHYGNELNVKGAAMKSRKSVTHYWFLMQFPGHLGIEKGSVCVFVYVPLGMSIKGDGIYHWFLKPTCFLSVLLLFDRRKLALTLDACVRFVCRFVHEIFMHIIHPYNEEGGVHVAVVCVCVHLRGKSARCISPALDHGLSHVC